MGITPGIPRPGEGGVEQSEFDTFVLLVDASFSAVNAALSQRVLDTDSRLTDAREWTADLISLAEAEAGTSTEPRKFSALRARQVAAATDTFTPANNTITIGASTTAQSLRLRRRFVSAGDFSQLRVQWTGDVCQIQTQHSGNPPNSLRLGAANVDRLFIGTGGLIGINADAVARTFEIHTAQPSIRNQVTSSSSTPTYSEANRCFDIVSSQSNVTPFPTWTDFVANSSQFNAHGIRVYVHNSGTSAPILSTTFHSTGRVSVGTATDDGISRLFVSGQLTVDGQLVARIGSVPNRIICTGTNGTLEGRGLFEAFNDNLFGYPIINVLRTGNRVDSITYGMPGPTSFTRTFHYTGDKITSIELSGSLPAGMLTTKTITYSGNNFSATSYS